LIPRYGADLRVVKKVSDRLWQAPRHRHIPFFWSIEDNRGHYTVEVPE
jgi:hypothetical protein